MLQTDYNTQREPLNISEYGRSIRDYVRHIASLPDKERRTRLAHSLVQVLFTLNPALREQADARQKLWDHLHVLSDFSLDVDSPFPIPEKEALEKKPLSIPYNDSLIRFRFYGRNLQLMALKAASMEEGELKREMVNTIASFMYNSCRSWNNENLSNNVLAEHLRILSKGALELNPEELEVSEDNSPPVKRFNKPQQQGRGGQNRNNQGGGRFNRRNKGFRKF